jgi:diphthine synthase
VFFTPTWRPDSFYDRIRDNRKAGLHTLCLLDIKVWTTLWRVQHLL